VVSRTCGGSGPTATATSGGTTPTATATATNGATATKTSTPTATPTNCTSCVAGHHKGGYFAQWGIYARAFPVSSIPAGYDRIYYAFSNPCGNYGSITYPNGCNGTALFGVNAAGIGDQWADYGQPQNGEVYNAPLKGNFHSLQLKYGGKGVSLSIGGWTWSDGFYNGAKSPSTMVASYIDVVVKGNIPNVSGQGGPGTAAGIFDGIDLDWEYPGVCGNNPSCAASSADKANYVALVTEFRKQMDAAKAGMTLSAFVSASPTNVATGYDVAGLSGPLNLIDIQGYDFFGAWAPTGPTALQAPLYQFTGQSAYTSPLDKFYVDNAISVWEAGGAPASKIMLGVPFYGRGWTGAFTGNGLNQPATGAAAGTYDAGVDDYKVLTGKCAANNTGFGTAWCSQSGAFWSYDTPATIAGKVSYKNSKGLAGIYAWSLDGDSANALGSQIN
jgi:chitinase